MASRMINGSLECWTDHVEERMPKSLHRRLLDLPVANIDAFPTTIDGDLELMKQDVTLPETLMAQVVHKGRSSKDVMPEDARPDVRTDHAKVGLDSQHAQVKPVSLESETLKGRVDSYDVESEDTVQESDNRRCWTDRASQKPLESAVRTSTAAKSTPSRTASDLEAARALLTMAAVQEAHDAQPELREQPSASMQAAVEHCMSVEHTRHGSRHHTNKHEKFHQEKTHKRSNDGSCRPFMPSRKLAQHPTDSCCVDDPVMAIALDEPEAGVLLVGDAHDRMINRRNARARAAAEAKRAAKLGRGAVCNGGEGRQRPMLSRDQGDASVLEETHVMSENEHGIRRSRRRKRGINRHRYH